MLNSRNLGQQTEQQVAEYFSKNGWWVYRIPSGLSGQAADIVMAKDGEAYLIEVKHCKNDRFVLNRIEENQKTAYKLFQQTGNKEHYVAIKFKNGTYLIHFMWIMKWLDEDLKSITVDTAKEVGTRIWIE